MSERPSLSTASTTRPLPRLRSADRQQLIPALPLENLLEQDPQARLVWDFCLGLDLSSLYEPIPARAGGPGRAAIDPRLGVALWLYATLEGVGSARALAWLCGNHHAFRWLVGGVSVNHPTLSDFRVAHVAGLDPVLTHALAVLGAPELVDLNRVAHDGSASGPAPGRPPAGANPPLRNTARKPRNRSADSKGTRQHGGVRQRPGAEAGPGAVVGARAAAGEGGRLVVGDRAQRSSRVAAAQRGGAARGGGAGGRRAGQRGSGWSIRRSEGGQGPSAPSAPAGQGPKPSSSTPSALQPAKVSWMV